MQHDTEPRTEASEVAALLRELDERKAQAGGYVTGIPADKLEAREARKRELVDRINARDREPVNEPGEPL